MNTRTTAQWQAADAAHFLHPFTDFRALAETGTRVIVRGDGIHLEDSEGNRFLDAMSGLWCVNVGYGRRELIDAATRQLETLPFYNAFFQTATMPAIELAELLAEVAPPGFEHVFYANSGSEGNDTIVRMVRRYWDVIGRARAPRRHQPPQRLPRLDHGRRLARRHGGHARPGRAADPRHRAHRPAAPRAARRRAFGRRVRPRRRRLAGGEDPRSRRRSASPPSSASRCRARAA